MATQYTNETLFRLADELLEPYKGLDLPPLSDEKNPDGNGFVKRVISFPSPPREGRSEAYTEWPKPIDGSNNAFDIHIYYFPNNAGHKAYVKALYERIRREFPELRAYRLWDIPVGPHPIPMFEINLFNPEQFGAIVPWLVVNRGPLPVLVHPNTGDDYRDHIELATWLGDKVPLDGELLRRARH